MIDIFYLDQEALRPSPWYGLPITILHDPLQLIATLVARTRGLSFTIAVDDVDQSISKGLAAAHEAHRRARRGELLYAQTLLDELRHHIMKADDWLSARTPLTAVSAKFEQRASRNVLEALAASFCAHDAAAIEAALVHLVALTAGRWWRCIAGGRCRGPWRTTSLRWIS